MGETDQQNRSVQVAKAGIQKGSRHGLEAPTCEKLIGS
jgi:hypothetical protein